MRTAGVAGGSRNLDGGGGLADLGFDALNGGRGSALRLGRAEREARARKEQSQADRGEFTAPERSLAHHLPPVPTETPTLADAGAPGAAAGVALSVVDARSERSR